MMIRIRQSEIVGPIHHGLAVREIFSGHDIHLLGIALPGVDKIESGLANSLTLGSLRSGCKPHYLKRSWFL